MTSSNQNAVPSSPVVWPRGCAGMMCEVQGGPCGLIGHTVCPMVEADERAAFLATLDPPSGPVEGSYDPASTQWPVEAEECPYSQGGHACGECQSTGWAVDDVPAGICAYKNKR